MKKQPPQKPAETEEEEKDLFLKEVEGARKIERDVVGQLFFSDRKPLLPDERREWERFVRGLMKGSWSSFDITLSTEYVEGRRKGVGPGLMDRLRRGEIAVEAAVDLHGLGRRDARIKVREFMAESRKLGRRCVLIVHGRGKRSRDGIPVLKQGLVSWMQAASGIGRHVLAFATARACDGGTGAVYVLLESL
jgi:DNA-nicking Smr family endonuclease